MGVKLRTAKNANGRKIFTFHCPGCGFSHGFDDTWSITGELDYPTVHPSLLSWQPGDNSYRCHLFIKAGKLEYLSDCSHQLAGQTVMMEDV